MEDEKKYLIDIAKDKTYQNQFDDYHKEFSKWRTKKATPMVTALSTTHVSIHMLTERVIIRDPQTPQSAKPW